MTNSPSPVPLGMSDFFALEAGEYLDRLDALLQAPAAPAADELVRLPRAPPGGARVGGPPGGARAGPGVGGRARGGGGGGGAPGTAGQKTGPPAPAEVHSF